MVNKLINENSPYLLQHANNPVDWYPWSSEALDRALHEEKPIFLSIGYAACHWCHVMAHESFEDNDTAAIMNAGFINIKVDREERPDLDNIYMNAVVAMTGQGGWPMSVFLTPEGSPFYGGTYFPPTRRFNMPSFQEVLNLIIKLWENDRERLIHSGTEIKQHIERQISTTGASSQISKSVLCQAANKLVQSYDWINGGWGDAPKFPQPMVIEFLLRFASRGNKEALEVCNHSLKSMAKGGIYDVIGGGFSRYSTDDLWLVPHFEKMLYDNAQLARVYLHAFMITGSNYYQQICISTLDFMIREMMPPPVGDLSLHGGFFSSIDADSEGIEGKFYTWTYDEIIEVFSTLHESEKFPKVDIDIFLSAYNITPGGNFEGKNVLQRVIENDSLSKKFDIPVEHLDGLFTAMHKSLLLERDKRIRPETDDKVLTSWNALALIAFSEAARYLRRPGYLEIARKNANFLLSNLYYDKHLFRSWRNGKATHDAYLEDYASLIIGLLSIYQSDPHIYWYESAVNLAANMLDHFQGETAGFFDTSYDHENLIIRPKNLYDNATPSGNSLAATALNQLYAYSGDSKLYTKVKEMFGLVNDEIVRYPLGFGKWLCAFDDTVHSNQMVAILGCLDDFRLKEFVDTVWVQFNPNRLAAISSYPPDAKSPEVLKNRTLLNDRPTAYLCEDFICNLPASTPNQLKEQLS